MRRLTVAQLSVLSRELAFELFHRGVSRWRVLLDIANDLDGEAIVAARKVITRRLAATHELVA